jgi:DNA polymerase elongation subunit (family B)
VLGIEDRNKIRKYSIFDDFEDHIDFGTLSGNINNEPTDSFETGNTVGTVLGTAAFIFEVLITTVLLRSKRDPVRNELEKGAVEYIADEISEYMYENNFKEMLHEMMSVIKEQDRDVLIGINLTTLIDYD